MVPLEVNTVYLCNDSAWLVWRTWSTLPGTIERDCSNYVVRSAMLCRIAGISYSHWQDMAGFLTLGGDFTLLGLSLPGLITFLIFWLINVGIGFSGGKVLNKFTAILNPCIYIVFGGMAIWAISTVGIGPILDYIPGGVQKAGNSSFCSGGD